MNRKLFGERLLKLREERNETQQQLAEALQAPNRETIARWENGSRDLKREHIIAIAKHFNVSTDYLLGFSDNPTTDPDIKIACEVTGLSDQTVIKISGFNQKSKKALNHLISLNRIEEILEFSELILMEWIDE